MRSKMMTRVRTRDGIELAYESIGNPQDPPLILIMGLGAQMHVWPDSLCRNIAAKGFRVIRFDNRDSGESTALEEHGNPSIIRVWLGTRLAKKKPAVPYTLKDMARDVIALMDTLELDSAHVAGASMGGMIAQILAAKHRRRIRSLTSIMSSATAPRLPVSQLQMLLHLARRPGSRNRDAHIEYITRMNRMIGSPGYPMKDDELQRLAETSWERTASPLGFKRQLAAITHAGDRRRLLQKIKARTLVIHGADDPLVPVTMGIETAALIRRSKLKIIFGMGHDFPEALVPRLTRLMVRHLKKSEKKWQARQLRKSLRRLPEDDRSAANDHASSLDWLNQADNH
ncbi:MAG: alpha/beta hydrolase [Thalassolituus sp.]|nr:MAG: alpha/beta hydrolase [Thalassolituus sp.]